MLRVLFNSDFFKAARFAKVKSPTETVVGTMVLAGGFAGPWPNIHPYSRQIRYMGQDLLNPPTVEGWHTGKEWIDSGTLVERINFAADQMANIEAPGVQAIIKSVALQGSSLTLDQLIDRCLEMIGGYQLPKHSRDELVAHAAKAGPLRPGAEDFPQRVGQVLQLIVSTQGYQFG